MPQGAPSVRGRAALKSYCVTVSVWHRTRGRCGCQPFFALCSLPSLACLCVSMREALTGRWVTSDVRGSSPHVDTPCRSPTLKAVTLIYIAQFIAVFSWWKFVYVYTHEDLDEAPSFRGLSSKTARTRAASQPVFMSYKLLEIERSECGLPAAPP